MKNKIAYSTENRRDEGIIGDLTVRQNILIALQATRGMFKPIPKKEADAIVDKYMKELNVRPADRIARSRISPAATSRRCSLAVGWPRTPSC